MNAKHASRLLPSLGISVLCSALRLTLSLTKARFIFSTRLNSALQYLKKPIQGYYLCAVLALRSETLKVSKAYRLILTMSPSNISPLDPASSRCGGTCSLTLPDTRGYRMVDHPDGIFFILPDPLLPNVASLTKASAIRLSVRVDTYTLPCMPHYPH